MQNLWWSIGNIEKKKKDTTTFKKYIGALTDWFHLINYDVRRHFMVTAGIRTCYIVPV